MAMNTSSGLGSSVISQQQRKISNQNIQVYVRVRPLNSRERLIRSAEVIDVISPREIVTRHTFDSKLTKKFTFDRTFGTDSRQVEVYSTVVAPLIEEVLSGYNCTVFAYGQTGTGKTHTMVGTECAELKSSWEDDSDIGIIPRALSHLFDELRMMEMEFSMRISYLELYNEELCDLLSSDDSVKIRIFDDTTKKGSVIIQGLEEIPVHSKDDVYKLLEKGKERRKTATTLMNAQSSRSHTVFSILVHIRENGIDGEEMLKIGKLNLVDLAGSENVSKAGNEKGIRVRETVNINQSLLTLGRVITALVERTPHIPYRESKLTRLLQESLGGRTKTYIIATISPGHKDIEETLSTLEYAHRAKNIQNKPEVNQKLTKKTVLKEYTEEIDKLKRDLIAARDKNGIYLAEETYTEITLKMDSQNRELNEKMLLLKALKDEMQNKEKIFNEVSLNLVEKTEELKRTEQNLTQTKGVLQQTKKVLNETKRRYKEKKHLLLSHVKTEEELINQATQILEVADTATKDTHQLHSTIERRRDVDQKIQTACERFTQHMHDHFELMDENLDNLQDQHKIYSQMILEEFSYTTTVHNKLLNEANQKVKKVNELNERSLAATCETSEKFSKLIGDLSAEHKTSLEKLFQEFKDKQLELKCEIESNLSDVEMYNKQQKITIDTMRQSIVQTLQRCTSDLEAHTNQLQSVHIKPIVETAESCIQDLMKMQKQIAKERSFADREQSIMDEFVERMQSLKNERVECTNDMSTLNTNLVKENHKSIEMLKESSECAQKFYEEHVASSKTVADQLEKQSMAAMLCADNNLSKCATLQTQLNTLSEGNNNKIDKFVAAEISHFYQIELNLAAHESEVNRRGVECKNQIADACVTVEAGLAEDTQQLKKHIAVANGFANSLQHQVSDYAKLYKEQMSNCVKDVDKFKQNELKTYTPTGTTPSKREYTYPRKLVATSPHNQIVKRFRQENEWSDLETSTIEEGSEGEQEQQQISAVQDISANVEVVLNSTPIDSSEIVLLQQQRSSTNNRNLTVLKPQVCNSSLISNNSPRKPSPPNMTSSFTKANKENV